MLLKAQGKKKNRVKIGYLFYSENEWGVAYRWSLCSLLLIVAAVSQLALWFRLVSSQHWGSNNFYTASTGALDQDKSGLAGQHADFTTYLCDTQTS